jgi:hypothetical protein
VSKLRPSAPPVLTALRMRTGAVLAPAILYGTADGTVLMTLALVLAAAI